MSIFRKLIDTIQYEDIIEFCNQGIKENVNLDYKADFPSDLPKTVSALANTFGGIIIIGIGDNDGLPKIPFEGIQYSPGLEERVIKSCVDGIYPPVIPEVKVCQNKDKVFILIRIQQSADTPHAIKSNTKAYVRTGNISMPEDPLSFDKITWLVNKRELAIRFRDNLFKSALEHVKRKSAVEKVLDRKGSLTLFASPTYPHLPLSSLLDLQGIYERSQVRSHDGFQLPSTHVMHQPIKDGISIVEANTTNNYGSYYELSQYGSIMVRYKLCFSVPATSRTDIIWMKSLIQFTTLFFDHIEKIYSQFEYWGNVHISIALNDILNLYFLPIDLGDEITPTEILLDSNLEYQSDFRVTEISDEKIKNESIIDITSRLAWALGHKIPNTAIDGKIKAIRN